MRAKAAALLAAMLVMAGCAHEPDGTGVRHEDDARAGAKVFRISCAACHGEKAEGNGPVAPLLNVKVPDLTRIASRRNGEFPELEIFRIIDGQSEMAAHGSRHMPVWGYEFFGSDADDEEAHGAATAKVDQLVAFLRSIQRN